jgi:hemoglobin/transferrin/lactoferrin receptor protein
MKILVLILTLILCSAVVGWGQYVDTLRVYDEDGFEIMGASVYEVRPSGKIDSSTLQSTDLYGVALLENVGMQSSIHIASFQYHPETVSIHEVRANGGRIRLQPTMLGEIVVKAQSGYDENLKEVPSKVSVIDKKDIQLYNPQTTADALLQSGEIYVQKSQMGGGSPIIRGFEANKVLMVIDGVRMNNAIYRSGHLQNVITIDNAALERVEVLHGASSVLYGSDALGGVMHFYTKKPRLRYGAHKKVDVNTYARFSTANLEGTGHIDINIGDEKFASFTSVTYSAFQDLRAGRLKTSPNMAQYWNRYFHVVRNGSSDSIAINENPNVQIGTGYSQIDAIQKLRYKPNEELEFTFNLQYSTSSNVPRYDQLTEGDLSFVNGQISNPSFTFAEWSYGPQQRLLASLTTEIRKDSFLLFNYTNITAAFQKIDEDRITRRFNDPLRRYQQENVYVFTLNADFVKQFKNKSKLLYGTQFTHNVVESLGQTQNINTGVFSERGLGTRYPDGGSFMSTAELYGSYRLKLNDRANIIGGARYAFTYISALFDIQQTLYNLPYSEVVTSNHAATGSLALAWDMGQQFQFNASVATAYRTPNIDDFGKIRAKGSDVTVPNPTLIPEKSVNLEGTLTKQFSKKVRLSGTFFYTFLFDAILQEPFTIGGVDSLYYDGDYYDVYANVNAGRATIWGFSSNLSIEFNPNVFMRASLTYTEGRELEIGKEPQPLAHIPPLYGQFDLGFKRRMLEARFNIRFNGSKDLAEYSEDSSENLDKALPEGTPAWFTINVYATLKFHKQFSMNIGLENLLDWHYRPYGSGVSAPGMNIMLTLRGKF